MFIIIIIIIFRLVSINAIWPWRLLARAPWPALLLLARPPSAARCVRSASGAQAWGCQTGAPPLPCGTHGRQGAPVAEVRGGRRGPRGRHPVFVQVCNASPQLPTRATGPVTTLQRVWAAQTAPLLAADVTCECHCHLPQSEQHGSGEP